MPTQPANPTPRHEHNDGMLARKFGKEVSNYFAGSPLNRLAFLRAVRDFLSQAARHPSTRYLPCRDLQPLVEPNTSPGEGRLAWVGYDDIKSIVGEEPFSVDEEEMVKRFDSRSYAPQVIFLGVDEGMEGGLSYASKKNTYTGVPHFAVDVTPRKSVTEACEKLIGELEGKGRKFAQGRVMDIVATDGMVFSSHLIPDSSTDNCGLAAIYAEARQLLDWNARNPFVSIPFPHTNPQH